MTYLEKNKRAWKSLTNAEKFNLYEKKAKERFIDEEFEIFEDNYFYENGLTIVFYDDKKHECELDVVNFNLDNVNSYLEFAGIG